MTPDPFRWQGRVDDEEPGDTRRWHQHVRPFDGGSRGGVALIGFAVDEGVRRNAGRPGAAAGPAALRSALANMPVLGEPAIWDAADIACMETAGDTRSLETAQDRLAGRVARAREQGCLPLVIGGGHEVAWGTFQGIARSFAGGRRLLVVNLDAHFDLRTAAQPNSGTPFRQIAQACEGRGWPFLYRVFGISRFGNTQALFDRAQALGARWWLDESLQSESGVAEARRALEQDLASCDGVYLTVCLDVLPAPVAPGVSAPSPLGVPLAACEALVDAVLASGKLQAADIAELNPALDVDGRTARVAARLAARIARGGRAAG
mgnify:CR=1 FL=1